MSRLWRESREDFLTRVLICLRIHLSSDWPQNPTLLVMTSWKHSEVKQVGNVCTSPEARAPAGSQLRLGWAPGRRGSSASHSR